MKNGIVAYFQLEKMQAHNLNKVHFSISGRLVFQSPESDEAILSKYYPVVWL